MKLYSINQLCSILQINHNYLFDIESRANSCYKSYEIPKKNNNGKRRIDAPNKELKDIQKKINTRILTPMINALPDYMHGARSKKGIRTNAEPHVRKEMLLSLDLENCFQNISYEKIYYALRGKGCSKSVSKILANLTTKNGILPQGCPTSPAICNLVLAPLIIKLHAISQSKNVVMTQYVDDLFFSGHKEDLKIIVRPILTSIWHFGLKHNRQKINAQSNENRMQVTGIVVNKTVSAGRKKIRIIERKIMKITKKDAIDYFETLEKRKNQDSHIKGCEIEKIYGEISNVNSINKKQGAKLKRKLNEKLRMYKPNHIAHSKTYKNKNTGHAPMTTKYENTHGSPDNNKPELIYRIVD